jgi:hypothetical protein
LRPPGKHEIYQLTEKFPELAYIMYDDPNHQRAPFFHDPGKRLPALDDEIKQLLQTAM